MDRLTTAATAHIETVVTTRTGAHGLELFEVKCVPQRQGYRIEITVDRPGGGVTIEECAKLSRDLAVCLEVDAPAELNYVLEVGSPGLTRPLKSATDFERFKGRIASLQLRAAVGGKHELRGRLEGYDAGRDVVHIAAAEAQGPVEVPLNLIAKARLDFEFPASAKRERGRARTAPDAQREDA